MLAEMKGNTMKHLLTLGAAAALLAACAEAPTTAEHTGAVHDHAHAHADDCGHTKVAHLDHSDFLHDGHMHNVHANHADEHVVAVSAQNPEGEDPIAAERHDGHMHSMSDEAHAAIPHGDHVDFLHDGHLHHVHGDHMDEHGAL